jgi:transcriptional regulator with XRE-family HTH domain
VEPLAQLGRNIKVMRVRRDMTQEELAAEAGLERSYAGAIERGERNLSVTSLLKLAQALGCSPNELLEGVQLRPAKRKQRGM